MKMAERIVIGFRRQKRWIDGSDPADIFPNAVVFAEMSARKEKMPRQDHRDVLSGTELPGGIGNRTVMAAKPLPALSLAFRPVLAESHGGQIGVPQNLLRLTAATRYAVIEMGTNHPGEILPLSRITMPEVAVVNSIAPCHLEFLGDLDGVAREKATIFAGLRPEGTAVIPADLPQEPILRRAAGEHRILTFGASKAADCRVEYLGGALAGSRFRLIFITGEDFTVDWRLTGAHQAINAAAAAAVAQVLGIAPALIAAGLPETVLPGMRMKTAVIAGVTYINDAYNANPASMQAALTQLLELHPSGRLILVLGGMRELGEVSLAEHHSLLEFVHREFPEALTITVGAEFDGLDSPRHFAAAADVAPVLSALVRSGDVVFAKGSRGVGVENALPPAAR